VTSPKLPDLAAALLVYLRADNVHDDGLVGLTADGLKARIYLEWPSDKNNEIIVPPFRNCIIISTGRGGQGDIGLGLQEERVDIYCYGISRRDAHQLWRRLDWYLIPPDRSRKVSVTVDSAHVRIHTIVREGGPIRLVDPDRSNWPYTVGSYLITYSGVPVG
jgi:hypothetical protein